MRTLRADQSGMCRVSATGYGVEIVDGGKFEGANLLLFARGDGKQEPVFVDDGRVACVPGARLAIAFDELVLVSPSTTAFDAIVVRVLTREEVGWSDNDPSGKPRRRWFTRGSLGTDKGGIVDPNTTVLLFDSDVSTPGDRFREREHFDVRTSWSGVVAGTREFLIVENVFIESETMGIAYEFTLATWPAQFFGSGGSDRVVDCYSLDLEGRPYPAGQRVQLWLYNSGFDPGEFVHWIGVRG